MHFFGTLCSDTSHAFMLVITFFTLLFFIAVYYTADKYKSIILIVAANAIKLLAEIIHYVDFLNEMKFSSAVHNLLSAMIVALLIIAVFVIFRIKIRIWVIAFFIAASLAQSLYFTLSGSPKSLIASINSYIISLMVLYGLIMLADKKWEHRKVDTILIANVLIIYSIFHILRGTVYLMLTLGVGEMSSESELIKLISILSYGLFLLMNFMIIYLNYNYLIRKVRTLSYTDKLTGALNRAFFIKLLEVKLSELKRGKKKLMLAMIDIDDFKVVNDTYGHLVGDEVLKGFTRHLRDNVRQNDIICRYGGEEFLILMEVSGKKEADFAIRRLHESVHYLELTEHKIKITFSGGMEYLGLDDESRSIEDLIKVIDMRLYEAKNAGKDCIV